MKVVVSSGKYSEILPLFAKQFNKYFSSDIEVIVLSPKELTGLPDNFSHHKIPFTPYWCNDIRDFFESFEDEIFLGCMEDHFLYSPVDLQFLDKVLSIFEDETVLKFCGTMHQPNPSAIWDRNSRDLFRYKDTELLHDAPVKHSLMPGIWRTDFFRYLLSQSVDKNAWEFEFRDNHYRLEPHIIEHIDNRKFLFSHTQELYSMSDVIRGGQPAMHYWEHKVKDPADIAVFREATNKVFPDVLWTT